jgi:hypothetical protein
MALLDAQRGRHVCLEVVNATQPHSVALMRALRCYSAADGARGGAASARTDAGSGSARAGHQRVPVLHVRQALAPHVFPQLPLPLGCARPHVTRRRARVGARPYPGAALRCQRVESAAWQRPAQLTTSRSWRAARREAAQRWQRAQCRCTGSARACDLQQCLRVRLRLRCQQSPCVRTRAAGYQRGKLGPQVPRKIVEIKPLVQTAQRAGKFVTKRITRVMKITPVRAAQLGSGAYSASWKATARRTTSMSSCRLAPSRSVRRRLPSAERFHP